MAKTRTHIEHPAALTPEDAASLSFGQAHWWLRQNGGDFVRMPKRVRGDVALDLQLDLEPGSYVLGVGPARGGVRVDIEVTATAAPEPAAAGAGDVEGRTFVLTGDLETMDRDRAKAVLEGLGGRVTGSVSGKTDYLVVGQEPGEKKIEKARELGKTLLDEAAFLALVGLQPGAPVEADDGGEDDDSTAEQRAARRYLERMSVADKTRKSAEGIASPDFFDDLGAEGRIVWGVAVGPRGGRYEVYGDLGNRNARYALSCNCSSRDRPCKHAVALVMTAAEHWLPPVPPPPGHQEAAQDRFSFME